MLASRRPQEKIEHKPPSSVTEVEPESTSPRIHALSQRQSPSRPPTPLCRILALALDRAGSDSAWHTESHRGLRGTADTLRTQRNGGRQDNASRRQHQHRARHQAHGPRPLRRVLQQLLRRPHAPSSHPASKSPEPWLRIPHRLGRLHHHQRTRRRTRGRPQNHRHHGRRKNLAAATSPSPQKTTAFIKIDSPPTPLHQSDELSQNLLAKASSCEEP